MISKDNERQYVNEQQRLSGIRIEYESLEIECSKLEKQYEYQRRENDSTR